jgi:hypothetical protein
MLFKGGVLISESYAHGVELIYKAESKPPAFKKRRLGHPELPIQELNVRHDKLLPNGLNGRNLR